MQNLKQWIKNTKRLFKINNEQSKDRKITEFFKNNNDIPVSKTGTPIQIAINRSDQPMTKKYANNTYYISKDKNNYQDSKYDGVSRNFKQSENSDAEEEIFQFGENRSESDIVSEESKNNIIENNILLTTSSTTYIVNMNIIESNKKEKLQHKTKNGLKYNEHISENNNTIDDNSRNTYSTNSTSY